MYATYRLDTPCGTSTKTPSFAKPSYGCVMPYHIHAATPPAIKTIRRNITSKYFNSASPIHLHDWLDGLGLPIQVLFQNNGGRHGVHAHFGLRFLRLLAARQFFVVDESSLHFFQQTLGLPAGEPFIDHFHRHANLLPHALREALHFVGHFAARAIQPQRQSHYDLLHTVLARQFAQAPHVLIPVDALHRAQRLGHTGL